MIHDNIDLTHYTAEDGKIIVRISDGHRMGWNMYLAETDSIENYEEQDMNEDDLALKKQIEEEQEHMFKHE